MEGTGVHVLQNAKTAHYSEIRCEEDDLVFTWAFYPRDGQSWRKRGLEEKNI